MPERRARSDAPYLPMSIELDHVFIWTEPGAPEAEGLLNLGLIEGSPNVHSGQGTRCRRFFFQNIYLELIWIADAAETRSGPAAALHLEQRWAGRHGGSCPFGLVFRPATSPPAEPPFASIDYRPAYLPAPWKIQMAQNVAALHEPLLVYLPFVDCRRPGDGPCDQPTGHASGLRTASRIQLAGPASPPASEELKSILDAGLIEYQPGSAAGVTIGFDGETRGRSSDLRPALPLILRW